MKAKIKTIEVQAKEWFDRVNGNSYFSARVYINNGLKGQRVLYLPIQYGYGDHYMDMAFKAMKEEINKAILKNVKWHYRIWNFCKDNKVSLTYAKQDKCLKRDCVAWGEE